MVKCSVGVVMWSTCKVVHHVHAVGALVHQAAQAHPLQARSMGGRGEVSTWSTASQADGRAGKRSAARRAAWPGLSQYQQLVEPQKPVYHEGAAYLAGAMPASPPRPVTRGESQSNP